VRVAFLCDRNSIHAVRWVNALASRGHETHLLTCTDGGGDPLDGRVLVHRLPVPPRIGYVANLFYVRRLLQAIRPALLHTHYASGYGTLGRLSNYRPHLLSVWGSDVYEFPKKSILHRRILQTNLRAADWVCSTSKAMAEQIIQICPVTGLSITPFGVDISTFAPRIRCRELDAVTVGTVKSLAPKYGIDLLIRSFAVVRSRATQNLMTRLRLLIVGSGPQESELRRLVNYLGLEECTTFVGRVPHSSVPAYLNQLDIYVALSRQESFGVAVAEASACGLPVVVSRVGGLPEVVVEGETGLIVPKEDVEGAAHSILSLIMDSNMRWRLGMLGRAHVVRHYSWDKSVETMLSVYSRLLTKEQRC